MDTTSRRTSWMEAKFKVVLSSNISKRKIKRMAMYLQILDTVKRLNLKICMLEGSEIITKCTEDPFKELIAENYLNIEKEIGI